MSKRVSAAQLAPHSWAVTDWPAFIYPGSPGKGRYVVRSHRSALIAMGAITRIGRDVVVLGAPYSRFLESRTDRVDGFTIAPNQVQEEAAL
jgi:hypothetical protein